MPNYKDWEQVPEEMIEEAAELAERMEDTPGEVDRLNFKRILAAGSIFKSAGLTPIYVWEDRTHRLAVYAEELTHPYVIN